VVRILFEEFEAVLARATQQWKRGGRILKVVLYGSYARGGWVDDPVGGYRSDYDILVVGSDERLTDVVDFWSVADDRLLRETSIARTLSAPVNFIVHSLADVNAQLERGRPFFVDIVEHGVALYEAEGFAFTAPRKLPEAQARAEAQNYLDEWFPSAGQFLIHGRDAAGRGWSNKAAFELHQAAERLYHCVLLVLNLYSPKSHKLNFLRSQAEQVAPELIEAWPRESKFERRGFELLRQAYVNARYSPHYKISDEELRWLAGQVAVLQQLVDRVCRKRLGQYA
jgi:predicted nucleotidyltransferase/HEPN domain-containing protein